MFLNKIKLNEFKIRGKTNGRTRFTLDISYKIEMELLIVSADETQRSA
jgi:hypothetical protein